ncbi:MAG: hypothetical protein FRX48_09478 [Lasallia pustulata]|uniref:Pentatricopeptide repeat n=1 Tax=Lasallia pustulata TaxID=136370 RepID=A0A5M8PBY9_9LECA|nr:MAG: hypothetical protein FRX48_09478 [Lasallia pustulata]
MQTLWSRAVPTKCTCRCSSCFSYGTALARRSTTATARRGLRFGDAFTAFYSSIFAIAAIADAKGKDARRKKWDEAIAGAKNDLEALERKQQSRVDASSADVATNEEARAIEQMSWQELFGRAVEEKKIRASLGLEGLKGIELDLLESLSPSEIEQLLPEVVCGDLETDLWRDWKSDPYFRRGCPTKKLKTFELSISKLVLRFLLESEGRRNATPEQPETPRATVQEHSIRYREELAKRIANIDIRLSAVSHIYPWPSTSMDLEPPNRPQYIKPFANEELNIALRTAILAWEEQKADIDTLMSRICYNLLVSSTPPDVHTYNMLIVVLCRLRQHGLVRAVLESMLECHVPPNTVTISAALRFYSATNDRSCFESYVKLVGSRNGVLDLGQPAISVLSRRSDVLPRYLHKRRLVRTNDTTRLPVDLAPIQEDAYMLVLQKAPRDQAVLEELFCGTLKFFGLSQARYCYKALVEEGWEVNIRILTLMLKRCARERYWRLGRMVWQQLHDLGLQAGKKTYYWMLSLCHNCQRDREFHAIMKQASSQGVKPEIPVSWNLSSLKRRIEASCREIGNTAKRVGDIELRIYRGPSSGLMINHKLKMLNLDSITTHSVTVRKDRDQGPITKKAVEARLPPVPVGRSIAVQEAKDRRRDQLTPQLLPLPYEAYPPLPRYIQDLPPLIELSDNRSWENRG